MTDEELKQLVANLAISQVKTDEELRKLLANLAISQTKTDAQLAKTDAQLANTDAQLANTDAQLAKTDAQFANTDAKLDRLAEMYGDADQSPNSIAEEFYFNTLKANPTLNGIHYDSIDKNCTRYQNGLEDEFDILLVNGQDIAIIEVKYRAHPSDLNRLIEKKAVNFRKLYPQYQHYQHHLVLATFSIDDHLKDEARSNGVIVLQRKGDLIETAA